MIAKKYCFYFLIVFLFCLSLTPAWADSRGRILHLPFDGNAQDTCGRHNGKVNGATLTSGHDGKANSAYHFNGKASIDVGGIGHLSSFTVMFWVYPEAYENHRNIFTLGGLSERNERFRAEIHQDWKGQKFTAFFGTGHGDKQYKTIGVMDTSHLPLNKWSFVAMVHDSSTRENRLYINNQLIGTVPGEVKLPSPSLYIGVGYQKTPDRYFKGKIDDFSVFNFALTASQIGSFGEGIATADNSQGTSSSTSTGGSSSTSTGGSTGTSSGPGTGQQEDQKPAPLVDSDNDGVYDDDEETFCTDKNNPDTDGDGIIDSEDLSPTANPAEPGDWKDIQEKGMVRLTFPVKAYGLDGWVEEYKKALSTGWKLIFIGKYTNQGVKKSIMTKDKTKKAINKLFNSSGFTCYDLKSITPDSINVLDTKQTAEHIPSKSEYSHIFPAKPQYGQVKEYRFYYDYVTDYWLASFKNSSPIRYPSSSNYYRYLLYPVKLKSGHENSIAIQFKSSDLLAASSKEPQFSYAFYRTNNFDTEAPFYESIAAAFHEKGKVFSVTLRLPREKCTRSSVYLKITPLWLKKTSSGNQYFPMNPSWDITGITRNIVYSCDSKGNSSVQSEDMLSFNDLNNQVAPKPGSSASKPSDGVKKKESRIKMFIKSPENPGKFNVIEMANIIYSQGTLRSGNIQRGFICIIESVVLKSDEVSDIKELPADHWARCFEYSGIVSYVACFQGTASLLTNGTNAWLSYKEGDAIKTVYYTAKTGVSTAGTLSELTKTIERTSGYSGATGKFACLATKKASVYIAIGAGIVEVGNDIYIHKTASDPLVREIYGEKILSDTADTGISVLAVVSPHVLAVQMTWTIGVEVYAAYFGEDFAYSCAKTPGTAMVFLAKYFGEGTVPTQMAEAAYKAARDRMENILKNLYSLEQSKKLPYTCIFVDPGL